MYQENLLRDQMYHMDLITQADFQNDSPKRSNIFAGRRFLKFFKAEMDAKFYKLKETLKLDKFTDEEFPVKSEDNNPWLQDKYGNLKYDLTLKSLKFT